MRRGKPLLIVFEGVEKVLNMKIDQQWCGFMLGVHTRGTRA